MSGSDLYGQGAPTVEVFSKTGRALGSPPTPERRRRPGTGGDTVILGIVEKIHAIPAYLHTLNTDRRSA